jgi:hypothetical protein
METQMAVEKAVAVADMLKAQLLMLQVHIQLSLVLVVLRIQMVPHLLLVQRWLLQISVVGELALQLVVEQEEHQIQAI